jgi:ATP-dependent DNA ligase
MNAQQIFQAIQFLDAAAPKEKISLLKGYLSDPAFKNFVEKALDPSIRYGCVYKEDWAHFVEGAGEIDFTPGTENPYYQLLCNIGAGLTTPSQIENIIGRVNYVSRQLIKRVINKDLRCGAGVETVNKAAPGTIQVFKCMLAHGFEPSRIHKWPVAVQEKLDGIRVLAIGGKDDAFVFYTRTGKEITSLEHIDKALRQIMTSMNCEDQMVFDGEVVTSNFNDTVSKVRKKSEQALTATFHIFDAIPLLAFGLPQYRVPLSSRSNWLEGTIGKYSEKLGVECVKVLQTTLANNVEEVMAAYTAVRDKNGEGIIVKPTDGIYEKRRSYNWLKIKDCQTADVKVIGFEEGTGKYVGMLGALVVDFNGVKVKVGSGLTDILRILIWRDQDHWLGRLIEVEYHEITPDGSLRHPRFIRDRTDDKPHEDGTGV